MEGTGRIAGFTAVFVRSPFHNGESELFRVVYSFVTFPHRYLDNKHIIIC